jgi:hypothetical protein
MLGSTHGSCDLLALSERNQAHNRQASLVSTFHSGKGQPGPPGEEQPPVLPVRRNVDDLYRCPLTQWTERSLRLKRVRPLTAFQFPALHSTQCLVQGLT